MKRKPTFAVYQDAAGQWRWHLKAANSKIIAQGESHATKRDAKRACATVKRLAALA